MRLNNWIGPYVRGQASTHLFPQEENADTVFITSAAGIDTVDYSTHGSGVTASLTAGTATGAGSDSFFEVEKLIGTEHDDTLTGNGVKNTLNGRGGDDTISGQGNADTLLGGDGNDSMSGGGGNDTVRGDAGPDAATTGAGTAAAGGS